MFCQFMGTLVWATIMLTSTLEVLTLNLNQSSLIQEVVFWLCLAQLVSNVDIKII